MSGNNDGGDKTEKPTRKRLEDARKKGDVPKSRDITSTAGLALWLAMGSLALGQATGRLSALHGALFAAIGRGWTHEGFGAVARDLGAQAAEAGVLLVTMLLVPAAMLGLLVEFLQAGPVLTFEKLAPKLDGMNPVEGVKRMFSVDHLVEVLKALAKTVLLLLVGWLIVRGALPQVLGLSRAPETPPAVVGAVIWSFTVKLLGWGVALFAFVSLLDWGWQRYSFEKKHRMSRHDIRQEMKESQGDPHVKGQRRRMQQEWSTRNVAQAARNASALVVNPTHIAIAIDYHRETSPVPTIAAIGEEDVALEMRRAAEEAGVPVVRNIPLARDLLARGEEGEMVPADLFEIIAQVILWAREVRERVDAQRRGEPAASLPPRRVAAPGEDLTRYQLTYHQEP